MRELDMFQHEKRGKERIITKTSDKDNWKEVKNTLIKGVGVNSIPVILIKDADYSSNRSLLLSHEHEGRDLQLEHAEKTLQHMAALWGKDVALQSTVNGKDSLLRLKDDQLKIERQ